MNRFAAQLVVAGIAVLVLSTAAVAQKVYLNPSDQTGNAVSGGGNEAEYALINANKTKPHLEGAGLTVKVDQDFYNAPANANSWGATVFVSLHTNAGGGHGTETLYKTDGGKILAAAVQAGLLGALPYQDRGLKHRTDLHVLNKTAMYACLPEAVFHDCAKQAGFQGHPPSESSFLKTAAGQDAIAGGLAAGICAYFGQVCGEGDGPPPNQKGWFKGVVYENPDLENRIVGATVTLNTGQSALTNETGYWEFELDPGTYTATATAPGYQQNSSERLVEAGLEVWGSIGLPPGVPVPTDEGGPEGQPDIVVVEPSVPAHEDAAGAEVVTAEGGEAGPNCNCDGGGCPEFGVVCKCPGTQCQCDGGCAFSLANGGNGLNTGLLLTLIVALLGLARRLRCRPEFKSNQTER